MVKAAEHRPGNHSASASQGPDNRTPEFEAAVRTIAVVIVGKFGEHGLKVALIDHDHVVQTLTSNGSHDPLADGVRLRRAWRRSYSRDSQIGQPLVKVAAVIRIPIVDEKLRLPAERRRLQHLAP